MKLSGRTKSYVANMMCERGPRRRGEDLIYLRSVTRDVIDLRADLLKRRWYRRCVLQLLLFGPRGTVDDGSSGVTGHAGGYGEGGD